GAEPALSRAVRGRLLRLPDELHEPARPPRARPAARAAPPARAVARDGHRVAGPALPRGAPGRAPAAGRLRARAAVARRAGRARASTADARAAAARRHAPRLPLRGGARRGLRGRPAARLPGAP